MELKLTLTVDECNYVLQALGTRPFAEVNALILKIKAEAESQLAPPVKAEQPTE